jgi:branched-chain amino acid transport system permease protein
MLGGLVLGVAETVPIFWLQQIWLEEVIAFGILIVILIFRPTGILGERLGRTA